MRDTRTICEVISQFDRKSRRVVNVSMLLVTKEEEIFLTAKPNLDTATSVALNNKQDSLITAAKGVVRVTQKQSLHSGTGFYLTPEIVATNGHVLNDLDPSESMIYWGNARVSDMGLAFDQLVKKEIAVEECILAGHGQNFKNGQAKRPPVVYFDDNDLQKEAANDPVLGLKGDYDLFDFAILKVTPISRFNNVLFIPSAEKLVTNDHIAVLGYPGHEDLNQDHYKGCQMGFSTAYIGWTPEFEKQKRAFGGFGRLCANFGYVLPQYKENSTSGLWEQVGQEDKRFIVSNENVFNGSSGSPLIKVNSCYSPEKIDCYSFVPFNAIHFSGEFVRCSQCLKESKLLGNVENVSRPYISWEQWKFCSICQNENTYDNSRAFAYNSSISVNHPLFVKAYVAFILPEIVKLTNNQLPSALKDWLAEHKVSGYF
ncbi:hypothetical protein ABK040_003654 [Willaertia magna]